MHLEINRPVDQVFHFYADQHVQNHHRWDPEVTLTALSNEPPGGGSVIKRHITRLGRVVDGEMTITEFDRDRAFAVEIHDGPATMFVRTTFTDLGGDRTSIDVKVDEPAIEDPELGRAIEQLMQRPVDNIAGMLTGDQSD